MIKIQSANGPDSNSADSDASPKLLCQKIIYIAKTRKSQVRKARKISSVEYLLVSMESGVLGQKFTKNRHLHIAV